MSNWPILVSVLIALATVGSTLFAGKAQARKFRAEASKLGAEEVEVYTEASTNLVRELRAEVVATKEELRQTKEELRRTLSMLDDMARKTHQQDLLVDDLTTKLEAAHARATYWEQEFARVTNAPPRGGI